MNPNERVGGYGGGGGSGTGGAFGVGDTYGVLGGTQSQQRAQGPPLGSYGSADSMEYGAASGPRGYTPIGQVPMTYSDGRSPVLRGGSPGRLRPADAQHIVEMYQDIPALDSKSEFPSLGAPRQVAPQGSSVYHPSRSSAAFVEDEFPALGSSAPAVASTHAGPNTRTLPGQRNDASRAAVAPALAAIKNDEARKGDPRRDDIHRAPNAKELYGLSGLLGVIRMTNGDMNTLALGMDLTTLGLNLNSSDVLYPTFASPWSDTPSTREPDYILPYCYYRQPPALKTSHLSKFQLETLFYIFYNMPLDMLQLFAAKELYHRDWKYHPDLKLWFAKPPGVALQQLGLSAGSYVYFDIHIWERRVYPPERTDQLTFLPEEEIAALTRARAS